MSVSHTMSGAGALNLGEVRGCSPQDLVLHRQAPVVAAKSHHLVLLGGGETVFDAVVDVGLAHPPPDGLDRHVEVSGDLGDGQVAPAGDGDHITLELGRKLLRHGEHPSAGHRPTHGMSTNRAADPCAKLD
jgi:hypothetical protein